MLLTIFTTHQPATDLAYLLHKNPAKVHEFPLSVGRAFVFYPEAATVGSGSIRFVRTSLDAISVIRRGWCPRLSRSWYGTTIRS